jgi:hypothetical protein
VPAQGFLNQIDLPRIVIFAGPAGSGKSEVSVNVCRLLKQREPVALVDLDIVKPLFRLRNMRQHLEPFQIRLISSGEQWDVSDLPVLPADLGSWLSSDSRVVIDLGGEGAGARVIRQYQSVLDGQDAEVFLVVNPYRPFSASAEALALQLAEIESFTGLAIHHLISNPHLKEHSSLAKILSGHQVVEEFASLSDRPILFLAVQEDLVSAVREAVTAPILPMKLFIRPPWEGPDSRKEEHEESRH